MQNRTFNLCFCDLGVEVSIHLTCTTYAGDCLGKVSVCSTLYGTACGGDLCTVQVGAKNDGRDMAVG